MKIRCKLGGYQVPLGNITYSFEKNHLGDFVADVFEDSHTEAFLAREDAYERYPDDLAPAAPPVPVVDTSKPDPAKVLREALLAAKEPKLVYPEGSTTPSLGSPWPAAIAMPQRVLDELPAFITMGGDLALTIALENAKAVYDFKGTVADLGHLYELRPDSSSFTPLEIEDEDEDEDEQKDVGTGTSTEAVTDTHKFAGVAIPEGWATLAWTDLKKLGAAVSDTAIKSKADANAAIKAELARRADFAKPKD